MYVFFPQTERPILQHMNCFTMNSIGYHVTDADLRSEREQEKSWNLKIQPNKGPL